MSAVNFLVKWGWSSDIDMGVEMKLLMGLEPGYKGPWM